MTCSCGNCDCRERIAALEAENVELAAHIALLVQLDERRHDAEKRFGRAVVEARGRVGERKL